MGARGTDNRRIGTWLLLAVLAGAWSAPGSAHGWRGHRGGHRGGVFLGFGLGLGYPGVFYDPYWGPPRLAPEAVVVVPPYYGPPAYVAPPAYAGPQPYMAPPADFGPTGQPAQPGLPWRAGGTAPYVCQNPAVAGQLDPSGDEPPQARGGAVIASLIMGDAGRQVDLREQACIGRALELARPGQRVTWQGAAVASPFSVVAGAPEQRGGRHCRGFDAEFTVDGTPRKASAVACRRPDGIWMAAG